MDDREVPETLMAAVREATARILLAQGASRPAVPPERRILFVLPDIEFGGGQLNGIRLANALVDTHAVFMLNARPAQFDAKVAELLSAEVIPLEGVLGRTHWYDAIEPWVPHEHNIDERAFRIAVVVELIRHYQIKKVLSEVWWSDRFTLLLRERTDFAWLVKFCGCYEALLHDPLKDPAFPEKAQRVLKQADGVTYGCAANLELFGDPRFPRPPHTRRLFDGFSRAVIDRGAGMAPPRLPSDFVYCICSRAVPQKGWEEAILAVRAINELPEAQRGHRRARLWLIGDGPAQEELKARYAGSGDVVFLGAQNHPHSIMTAADAGLLPSYLPSESVPRIVIESLACGRPVVATAVGAIPEMLRHGSVEGGIVVPTLPGYEGVDVPTLAAAMVRYMVDDALYRKHVEGAELLFDRSFDISRTVDDYLSFFAEAACGG